MMKSVKFRVKKKYRWVIIPVVIILLALVLVPQMFLEQDTGPDAWTRIRQKGQLVALAEKNSMDYFLYRGEPRGYQLKLLESFARYLGVSLKILASDDISESWYFLDHHAGDIIAWNLPVSPEMKYRVHFAQPFWETRFVLVQKGPKYITDPKGFSGDTVFVERNSFMAAYIHHFIRTTRSRVTVIELPGTNQEELVKKVSEGKIRFTICRDNLAQVMKSYYRNIDARMVISDYVKFAWGVNLSSDSLMDKINEWLSDPKTKKEIRKIYIAYYDNPKLPGCLNSEYCSVMKNRISPFDEEIRRHSKLIWWDWRLIASLIYEESNFHMDPVSSMNARGLMQLVPETAEKFGMDSLAGSSQQILSGIKYLKWLDKQLPPEIHDPRERVCFILAAYNVGIGRVLNARQKAAKYGQDPNKWNGNVDYYLTRKSKKDPYGMPDADVDLSPFGEPGSYVDKILNRYYHYRNLIPR
jgi:membrane-bound lytic murein transglycosylase F